jgi:nucleoside-diphosphate-sugar epimerase
MKNILVLGSEGQVGKPLVAFLRTQGFYVSECDIVLSPDDDLRSPSENLARLISDADLILFLAYDVGGSRYLSTYQGSMDFLANNTKIMLNVFEMIERHNKKFLFASSQMSNMTFSPYGTLKALGEHYTRALGGVVIKFWNVYGYENVISKAHVITDFIDAALIDGHFNMLTSGDEKRQFLHVDDCSKAIGALIDNYSDLVPSESYDITSFQETSILEVAQMIGELTNATFSRGDRSDDVQKNLLNKPTEAILRYWEPKIEMEEGIGKIVLETRLNLDIRKNMRKSQN